MVLEIIVYHTASPIFEIMKGAFLTGAILISVIILKCRNKRNAKNEKIISMAMCGGINLSQCIPVAEQEFRCFCRGY